MPVQAIACFENSLCSVQSVQKTVSVCYTVELSGRTMTRGDHPNQDPIDLNDLENFTREPETESEDSDSDSGSESGFEFESGDEISEDIFFHYVAERDHEDLLEEHEAIKRQAEEVAARAEAVEEERQEVKRAIKRKLEMREVLATKRLRLAVAGAYEAMNIAVPLFEGDAAGSDRAAPEEVVAAVTNFELAADNARRCLNDLTLIQDQMEDD